MCHILGDGLMRVANFLRDPCFRTVRGNADSLSSAELNSAFYITCRLFRVPFRRRPGRPRVAPFLVTARSWSWVGEAARPAGVPSPPNARTTARTPGTVDSVSD